MHRQHITQALNGVLSAGRRGADVSYMDYHVNKHPDVPFSSVEALVAAARDSGVQIEELNIAQIELEPENRDRDPVRDLVADVFEQSPSEEE